MTQTFQTYWIPPDIDLGDDIPKETREIQGTDFLMERINLSEHHLFTLMQELKKRKAQLMEIPIDRFVNLLHLASLEWLEKEKESFRQIVQVIAAHTGLSPQMVTQSIGHEMESSLGTEISRAIENEIGNPLYLDQFTFNPHLKGETFAIGPTLVGGIVSSNIPALSHLTVMRSLVVKAPCIVKTSVVEPFFLPSYAKTLWQLAPDIARAVAVVNFSRGDEVLASLFLNNIDFLVAYGSIDTIENLRADKPPGLRALFHGHKLGFGLISMEEIPPHHYPQIVDAIAYDVSIYDQEACLAPHVIFFEGTFAEACQLGQDVAHAMESLAQRLPPAQKTVSHGLAIRQHLDLLVMNTDSDTVMKIFPAGDEDNGLVIVQETETFEPSPLGRILRIVPVNRLEDALPIVQPLTGMMQNAALLAPLPQRQQLAKELAIMGVSRICPPGNMGMPSMMWHHDGKPCIAQMLRFADYEERVGQLDPKFT